MGRYDKSGSGRTRNYATVIYSQDSVDLINELHIPCFISPWHDKDVNANGEHKKAHRHVLMNFDSVKSLSQVQELVKQFGGVGCEVVQSNRAYARYLCHLDNPEKALYDINEVQSIGGLDYIELINSLGDEFSTLYEIVDYVLDNNICNMREFLIYCRKEQPIWFELMFRKKHLFDVKEVIKANLTSKSMNDVG